MNSMPISATAAKISPFRVMKILAQAKQLEQSGMDVIHMEIGEPDFPSLDEVHQAALNAVKQGKTHYTPTLGLPELRQAIADYYQTFYKAHVHKTNVVVTPGSSSALQLVLTALINAGDSVLLPDPTYPCNRQFIELLNGKIVSVPVDSTTDYQLNTQLLKENWNPEIKVVMVATPSNPTGTVIEQNELMAMAKFLAKKNAWLIVDEIYQGLVYERPAESILAQAHRPNNIIVINSFSKFFGMTGWRLGWTVVPDSLVDILDRLGQNLYLAAPTPSQYGALAVLKPNALAKLESRRKTFESRRQRLYTAMTNAGFELKTMPLGAFYLYWNIETFSQDSEQFCADLLQATGVAITPGTDFGQDSGQTHVRLAYTNDRIEEAVARIQKFIESRSTHNL
jgi:aspartate/methionine/tyrosine aminotransferase